MRPVIATGPFMRGRDPFDPAWYLGDRDHPAPNLALLNRALAQTKWPGGVLTPGSWREAVAIRLKDLKWDRAVEDVRPFLEREADLNLLRREDILRLLAPAPWCLRR